MVIWNEHPRNEWVFEEEPSAEQRKALKTFRAAHSWLQRKNALQCTIGQILICTAVHCEAYFHCAQIKTHCSVLYTLEIDHIVHILLSCQKCANWPLPVVAYHNQWMRWCNESLRTCADMRPPRPSRANGQSSAPNCTFRASFKVYEMLRCTHFLLSNGNRCTGQR